MPRPKKQTITFEQVLDMVKQAENIHHFRQNLNSLKKGYLFNEECDALKNNELSQYDIVNRKYMSSDVELACDVLINYVNEKSQKLNKELANIKF